MGWFDGASDLGGRHHRSSSSHHHSSGKHHSTGSIFGSGDHKHNSSRSSFFGIFPYPSKSPPPASSPAPSINFSLQHPNAKANGNNAQRNQPRPLFLLLQALSPLRLPQAHLLAIAPPAPRLDLLHEAPPHESLHVGHHALDYRRRAHGPACQIWNKTSWGVGEDVWWFWRWIWDW